MTEPSWWPPEHYVHGVDAPVVVVPGRAARRLVQCFQLDRYHVQHRGEDAELDAVIVALRVAGLRWATSVDVAGRRKQAEVAPLSEWLNATEVAELVGVTAWAVRLAIREGRLSADKLGGRWQISREAAQHWRASRRAA